MNCEHLLRVLDAYLDSELDEGTHAQVQSHLAGCAGCAGLRAERDALRNGLRRLPRHEAPLRLRSAVGAALASTGIATPVSLARGPRHWRAAASASAAAALSFGLGVWVATPPGSHDLPEQAIAQHVASFDGSTPRVQVASTDRHVVKPWFAGKLDFAPPVRDLSPQGFVLAGGRVDTLGSRPAAVLVYRIRQHQVTLFVSRSSGIASSPASVSTRRGFAIAAWAQDGLTLWAVSDVDASELRRFAGLVQAPAP